MSRRLSDQPLWLLGSVPLVLIAVTIGTFAALGGPGLGERTGPPIEELAVERTVLRPGAIELTVRNTGADAVTIAQASVAEVFVDFDATQRRLGRLEAGRLTLEFPWQEGSPYAISLITSTGATSSTKSRLQARPPPPAGAFSR
jgi:zinc transporter, ZIP family